MTDSYPYLCYAQSWLHGLIVSGAVGALAVSAQAENGLESAPLEPRSPLVGSTLFRELDSSTTGIVTRNDYADPRMWGDRYQEFALGGMGTGVAIADYDNDGWPDVFVVSKTESSRLFRNLGNWQFEDVTAAAGLEISPVAASGGGLFGGGDAPVADVWKQGASFADVDNDGWVDLYVCRWGEPNWLFMNQGDGTFREEGEARGLALIDASGVGAFADYDRDGWLDVYVQTNMLNATANPNGQPDHLFRNNGDGTFRDVSAEAGIGGPNLAHSTTWWDYNSDGWPDIYIANDFAPADFLYRNNRDGTFTNVIHDVVPTMPYSSMGADQGDINNDGLIDFLVTDMATTSHEKDQRGMASARELSREDSDSPTLAPQTLRNTMFVNTPAHRMLEVANMAGIHATDWTWSVRFEDLDNDGRVDLHVTNGMNREYQNADLRDRIILAENPTVRLRTMKESPRLNEANLAYRNDGDLQFTEVGADWGLNKVGISFGVAMGDLDRDGDLDIVHANYGESATVLENQSQTGNVVQVALRGTESNRFGVGARVTIETASGKQVRELVLSRGYLSTSELMLHFGVGDDEVVSRLVVNWPSGETQAYRDLPVNQRFTVTEGVPTGVTLPQYEEPPPIGFAEATTALGLNLNSTEGPFRENTRQPLVPRRFDRLGPSLAVGDLNGDGVEDMVMGGTTETPARIIAGTGDSKFVSVSLGPLTQHPVLNDGPVLIFEADGDGDADVLITRATDAMPVGDPGYQPLLLLNNGRGGLSPAPEGSLPDMPVSAGATAAVDIDRDGDLDVFVGGRVRPGYYPESPRSYLLINNGGRFTDATANWSEVLAEVGLVTGALWSDADDDGWPDLVLTTEWGHVRVFQNQAGNGLIEQTESWGFAAAGKGWWTSIVAGDFNGDGRMDYVAGNAGLNTPYRASVAEPAVLYYGDFRGRGRGTKRIIEAYYEDGRLLPRRTSKAIGSVVPTVRRKFRRNDDFAAATLAEILGEDKLDAAERFEATELRSGLFLSQPGGGFSFSPLPRSAQIAPVQGMVALDINYDGHPDLRLVHNSFAAIPVVGRFDGGLGDVLLGDGTGDFRSAFDRYHGLPVSGDAKAVVRVQVPGWEAPNLITSRSIDPLHAVQGKDPSNRPVRGQPLWVRLTDGAGNPQGVGAKVTVTTAAGESLVGEVRAGEGYMSQSSPSVYFGLPSDAKPASITVRWPDGASTEHSAPAGESSISLSR